MSTREGGPLGPYSRVIAVTPSDTDNLARGAFDALWCSGAAGNVALVLVDGSEITLPIEAGFAERLAIKAVRVKSTGTTAAGLFALYV